MLAKTLRLIEQSAYERPAGWHRPLYLPAVREHHECVETLARALESLEQPVTPAGMLRVVDLVTDGAGPLLGDEGRRAGRCDLDDTCDPDARRGDSTRGAGAA